jgi:hypothetical protein
MQGQSIGNAPGKYPTVMQHFLVSDQRIGQKLTYADFRKGFV